jgi:hypothetical protein
MFISQSLHVVGGSINVFQKTHARFSCGDRVTDWPWLKVRGVKALISAEVHAQKKLDRVLRHSYGFAEAAGEAGRRGSRNSNGSSSSQQGGAAAVVRGCFAVPIPPSLFVLFKEDVVLDGSGKGVFFTASESVTVKCP